MNFPPEIMARIQAMNAPEPGAPPAPGQQAAAGSGYQSPMATPSYGANPWGITPQSQIDQGMTQSQNNLQGMGSKLNSLYPTYSNSMGLGSGNFGQGSQQNPTPAADNSRGLNPWSLSGEALSR